MPVNTVASKVLIWFSSRMHSGNPSPEVNWVTDQEEAIASLDLRELQLLHKSCMGPWRFIFRRTQLSHEQELARLRVNYPEMTDSPPYDETMGIEDLLGAYRTAFTAESSTREWSKLLEEKRKLGIWATEYFERNRLEQRFTFMGVDKNLLVGSLTFNLYGLLAARTQAWSAFNADRNKILRARLPGVNIMNEHQIRTDAVQAGVTPKQIKAVDEEVKALTSFKTSLPDFFQCSPDKQQQIINALGKEWEEMLLTFWTNDRTILYGEATFKQRPLAYLPLADLRRALEQNPSTNPGAICRLFLNHSTRFASKLAVLTTPKPPKPSPIIPKRPEIVEPVFSKNERAIDELLQDPHINPNVLDLCPGDTVALTPEGALIPRKDLEPIVDKHLQLIGRVIYEGVSGIGPEWPGVNLVRWDKFNVGEVLRGNFNGNVRNLQLTRLPVSQQELQAHFGTTYDPKVVSPESVTRLIFSLELKGTGRKAESAMLNMLLVVRAPKGETAQLYKAKRGARSTSLDVVESLRMESIATGWKVAGRQWRWPILAGIRGQSIEDR